MPHSFSGYPILWNTLEGSFVTVISALFAQITLAFYIILSGIVLSESVADVAETSASYIPVPTSSFICDVSH